MRLLIEVELADASLGSRHIRVFDGHDSVHIVGITYGTLKPVVVVVPPKIATVFPTKNEEPA